MLSSYQRSSEDVAQLWLSDYELEQFGARKPLVSNCLRTSGKLSTALHSWGSQVLRCPCGCRPAFAASRLDRGISGVLIPVEVGDGELRFRHPHPAELALLCGCSPLLQFGSQLRLGLALIGQVASPLQAAWVLNHLRARILGCADGGARARQGLTSMRATLLAQAVHAGLLGQAQASQALRLLQLPVTGGCLEHIRATGAAIVPNPCFHASLNLPGEVDKAQSGPNQVSASKGLPSAGLLPDGTPQLVSRAGPGPGSLASLTSQRVQ